MARMAYKRLRSYTARMRAIVGPSIARVMGVFAAVQPCHWVRMPPSDLQCHRREFFPDDPIRMQLVAASADIRRWTVHACGQCIYGNPIGRLPVVNAVDCLSGQPAVNDLYKWSVIRLPLRRADRFASLSPTE